MSLIKPFSVFIFSTRTLRPPHWSSTGLRGRNSSSSNMVPSSVTARPLPCTVSLHTMVAFTSMKTTHRSEGAENLLIRLAKYSWSSMASRMFALTRTTRHNELCCTTVCRANRSCTKPFWPSANSTNLPVDKSRRLQMPELDSKPNHSKLSSKKKTRMGPNSGRAPSCATGITFAKPLVFLFFRQAAKQEVVTCSLRCSVHMWK
mmetsp:Transcript_33893/g.81253  ORF Transcript_33893/g.81253 Transcript_33893/m.81253 type:complete len:204 (+) Transcript_33893:438-1049(+)